MRPHYHINLYVLTAKETEHLLRCLLAICICSSVTHLFIFSACFRWWLLFFLLIYDSCLYIMDIIQVLF